VAVSRTFFQVGTGVSRRPRDTSKNHGLRDGARCVGKDEDERARAASNAIMSSLSPVTCPGPTASGPHPGRSNGDGELSYAGGILCSTEEVDALRTMQRHEPPKVGINGCPLALKHDNLLLLFPPV